MKNLLYHPYPYLFDQDIKLISEHCDISQSDSINVYSQLRQKYGELEWLTFNKDQKISRVIDYRDNFLTF